MGRKSVECLESACLLLLYFKSLPRTGIRNDNNKTLFQHENINYIEEKYVNVMLKM